ncbi:MAG: hypothetical protein ABR574_01080 [Cryomorphaceae bacterium]|nr:hypothetical protein [Flavobacteriales bacterium]
MRNAFFLFIFLVFAHTAAHAQGTVSDTTLSMSLFQFQGGLNESYGDMGDLYGPNASIGFSFAYKFRSNILLGADFTYLFSNNVRDVGNLMQELRNNRGDIIGIEGEPVNILVQMRGFTGGFYIGKIWPIFGPNPNSGLVTKLGLVYLEHRTWIESREDEIPPIEEEYRKGYDRKRAGLAAYQFVGYQHFSNSRFANFYAGFDFYQGFTTDYRSYNFDEMRPTNGDYFDLMVGFRVGWVIPVYRQEANKFYLD